MRFQRTSGTRTVLRSIFHHPTNENPMAATNRVACFPGRTWGFESMVGPAETPAGSRGEFLVCRGIGEVKI